ncbi:hypothetical protein B0T16DRAFT_111532 [Cercophora newfieldiana]|uniref:Uncharacterized protein n=1 Tax=Cercophora newfieldiana TaxID=92897 RepID=A0AA40CWF2_9PEZI|nr:hypothetical protein B0T16DRAFT_111532 [Cercophora newfieldiana]
MDKQAIYNLVFGAVTAENRDQAIAEAVQKLSAQAADSVAKIGDFVWDVFNAIFDVSAQLPEEKQSNLVDLMVQLRQVAVTNTNDEPVTCENKSVWTDLPTFGWVARKLWNFDALAPLPDGEVSKLERISTFLALLTTRAADSNNELDFFDFSLFGLWNLRTAFEDQVPEDVGDANAVRLAAPWVTHAGAALWKLSDRHVNMAENCGVPGAKYAKKGWKGFTKDRWQVWKDGFIAAANGGSPAVKEVAKTAVSQMEKASPPS